MAKDSVRDLGESQLVDRLAEEKDRLFKLRFQLATGQQSLSCQKIVPIQRGASALWPAIAMLTALR